MSGAVADPAPAPNASYDPVQLSINGSSVARRVPAPALDFAPGEIVEPNSLSHYSNALIARGRALLLQPVPSNSRPLRPGARETGW